MARTGRPRKPTALKKAQGTFRKDRALVCEMAPPPGIPSKPAYLDALAASEWDRVAPRLLELGLMTMVDGGALEGYCANYSLAVRYQKAADKHPMVRDRFGALVANPAAAAARAHWALCKQFAQEFGFTPGSRSKVSAAVKPPGNDAVAEFFFGADKCPPLRPIDGGRTEPSKPDGSSPGTAGSESAPTLGGKTSDDQ